MKIINNSGSSVGLPGIGPIGAGEYREVTEEQVEAIEGLPIVANWIKRGSISIDRGSDDLDEPFVEHSMYIEDASEGGY